MLMRYLWAAPTTLVGLAVATLALPGGRLTCVDGVIEAHGPLLRWVLSHLTLLRGGVAAITLGHVVVATDAKALEWTRAHERVHVRQCERWGPLFLPAYAAASLWAFAHARPPYLCNAFEREAWRSAGFEPKFILDPDHANVTDARRIARMSRAKLGDGG